MESEDYRTYVKNLRAIGCPEATVRDIVTADVLQSYTARRKEVMAERYRDFEYWKSDQDEAGARAKLEARRRALDEETAATLKDLLGGDGPAPSMAAEWQEAALAQQLSFLPEDKRSAAQGILEEYASNEAQFRELASGHGTPESPEERRFVLEAYERKLAGLREILTPEEFERVDMTVSWTADNLRRAMTKFQPTEEEFRLIFREWRAQDENLARLFGAGQPDPGNAHVFARIKELLPPDRYELYRETWWK